MSQFEDNLDVELSFHSLKLKKFGSSPQSDEMTHFGLSRINPRQVDLILELHDREKQQLHQHNSQDDVSEKSTKPDDCQSQDGLSKKSSFNVSRKNSGSSSNDHDNSMIVSGCLLQVSEMEDNFEKQSKSKWLQNEYLVDGQRNRVFEELIKPNIAQYSQEKYGHFIILLVLKQGLTGHKQLVVEEVYFALEQLSKDQYGHKIIEQCLDETIQEQSYMLQKYIDFYLNETNFKKHKLHLDQYGNYIIQKLLQICSLEDQMILLQLLKEEIIYEQSNQTERGQSLSSNQYGCLVFQAILDCYQKMKDQHNTSNNRKLIASIIKLIVKNVVQLSNSQFSNYMIQQIIIKQVQPFFYDVCNKVFQINNFVLMATHKYGSNVAEKCVHGSTSQQFDIFQNNLVEPASIQTLKNLINDKYANFVAQRLYERGSFKLKKILFDSSLEMKKQHQLSEFGQKAFQFMQKQFHGDTNPHTHHKNNHKHHNNHNKNNHYQHQQVEYTQKVQFPQIPLQIEDFSQSISNSFKLNFLPPNIPQNNQNRFNGFKTNPLHSKYNAQLNSDSRIPISLCN